MLLGQSVNMDQLVTLHYRNVRLGDAIQNISTKYKVFFTYSKHYVPVEKRVNIQVAQVPLSIALDELFSTSNVVYTIISNQIVLRQGDKPIPVERDKLYGKVTPPMRAIEEEPVLVVSNRLDIEELPVLKNYGFGLPEVFSETPEEEVDTEQYYVEAPKQEAPFATAQVSIVPDFGTNMESAKDRTNNFSLNVLGGENGGVNGVEIGGLYNKVRRDVNGMQIAGVFNAVGGDVGPAHIIKGKRSKSYGVQIAGLVNVASNVRAVQISGLTNINRGDFEGMQFAGLGNWNNGYGYGVQFSGLFNINGGDSQVQVAGLTNIARDVDGTQISGFFNRAKKVDGVQFALINVCDTVSGASIGLLNFVQKGYNQIELGGSETMFAQGAIRFGSFRFYNILQFGTQFKQDPTYAFGYGIGTTVHKNPYTNWQRNTELVFSKLIEEGARFRDFHLLAEFRWTWEYKMARYASLYFGPTINLMASEIKNVDVTPVAFRSNIPTYTLWESYHNSTPYSLNAWIGFRAGLRFGRN